jgi:hypothetical protein
MTARLDCPSARCKWWGSVARHRLRIDRGGRWRCAALLDRDVKCYGPGQFRFGWPHCLGCFRGSDGPPSFTSPIHTLACVCVLCGAPADDDGGGYFQFMSADGTGPLTYSALFASNITAINNSAGTEPDRLQNWTHFLFRLRCTLLRGRDGVYTTPSDDSDVMPSI